MKHREIVLLLSLGFSNLLSKSVFPFSRWLSVAYKSVRCDFRTGWGRPVHPVWHFAPIKLFSEHGIIRTCMDQRASRHSTPVWSALCQGPRVNITHLRHVLVADTASFHSTASLSNELGCSSHQCDKHKLEGCLLFQSRPQPASCNVRDMYVKHNGHVPNMYVLHG